jgi:hypothetical protein
MSASDARYSQPIEPQPRDVGGPVVYAGFVGRFKRVGFIFRAGRKEQRVEASRENSANDRPRGFFQSLAQLFRGNQ